MCKAAMLHTEVQAQEMDVLTDTKYFFNNIVLGNYVNSLC